VFYNSFSATSIRGLDDRVLFVSVIFLPIVYMLPLRCKSGAYETGPLRLGWAGSFINIVAICWLALSIFFRHLLFLFSIMVIKLTDVVATGQNLVRHIN